MKRFPETELECFEEDKRLAHAIVEAFSRKEMATLDTLIEDLKALHEEIAERFGVCFPKDSQPQETIPPGKIRYKEWMQKMRLRQVN